MLKRTNRQAQHRHLAEDLAERAAHDEEQSTKTRSQSQSGPTSAPSGGITTTTTDSSGGVLTIVIVVSNATPNSTILSNSTLSQSSTLSSSSISSSSIVTSSSVAITPSPTPAGLGNHTESNDGLSTGEVAGISVAATVGGLALLALILYLFRRRYDDRRHSIQDMMHQSNMPSSFPDPYSGRLGAGGVGAYEDLGDEDDGGQDGEMSQASRRRSQRSQYAPGTPY